MVRLYLLLAIILLLAITVTRAGSVHTFNIADEVIQTRMKWIILRSLVAMFFFAVIAALFNIVLIQ